jgi:chemotaxis protein MotA
LVVVLASVLGGFMEAGGPLGVLIQPADFIVIGGAALGSMLVATSPKVLKQMLGQLAGITKSGPTSKDFLDLLLMLYELLNLTRREGLLALEGHVEKPEESEILKKYPSFLRNHHAVAFMCDTLRLILTDPDIQAHDLDALMDTDLETHHHEVLKPAQVLQTVGDSLPGLGIVAAVLGIIITMGAIDGPPAEIGEKVGAALVGTFLGILLCYGFLGPLSQNLAAKADVEGRYYLALKQVLLAFHKGCAPAVSVEFARRTIYSDVRPSFSQLDEAFRAAKSGAAAG